MIGTGIYSTPSTILRYTGSIGASMFYWTSGFFISLSSMGELCLRHDSRQWLTYHV